MEDASLLLPHFQTAFLLLGLDLQPHGFLFAANVGIQDVSPFCLPAVLGVGQVVFVVGAFSHRCSYFLGFALVFR